MLPKGARPVWGEGLPANNGEVSSYSMYFRGVVRLHIPESLLVEGIDLSPLQDMVY